MGRLPVLYEMVGRYEDALNITPVSFDLFGRSIVSCDVAGRRLNGWLDQLSESGGVSEVERCLDVIYEWMDKASDVDDEERDHIGECPTATRQFWAWYYGNALGRLLVARPSLRASLLDETDAGEWENCWHVAGVLFETLPDSWDEYRQRALKFYNSSDIEYHRQGSVPWNVSRAAGCWATGVSLFRINVRLSGRQKCHSVMLPWYQPTFPRSNHLSWI